MFFLRLDQVFLGDSQLKADVLIPVDRIASIASAKSAARAGETCVVIGCVDKSSYVCPDYTLDQIESLILAGRMVRLQKGEVTG